MAGHRTHMMGGCFVATVVVGICMLAVRLHALRYGELYLCTMVGAMFPDVDIKSKGQQLWYGLLCVVWLASACCRQTAWAAYTVPVLCAPLLVRHRGPFHDPLILLGLAVMTTVCATAAFPGDMARWLTDGTGFLAGVYTHLLIDRVGWLR